MLTKNMCAFPNILGVSNSSKCCLLVCVIRYVGNSGASSIHILHLVFCIQASQSNRESICADMLPNSDSMCWSIPSFRKSVPEELGIRVWESKRNR